jgi:DUF971 family protein
LVGGLEFLASLGFISYHERNLMNASANPRSLKNDGDALVIEWSDGVVHRILWRTLRTACPCATCRVERAKPPQSKPLLAVLKPAEAQPLIPVSMRPIGNYAYAIAFNDGHSSGIYSLDLLRELGAKTAASAG